MKPKLTVSLVSNASSRLVPAVTNLGRLRISAGHVDAETVSSSPTRPAAETVWDESFAWDTGEHASRRRL